MRSLSIVLVALVAGVACGGEDTPAEKCDDLVSTVCDRAVQCIQGSGTEQQCVQQLQSVIPCGSATSVKPSFDRCMTQLRQFSCPVLFPTNPDTGRPELVLPADCEGVIQAEREAEPAAPLETPLQGSALDVVDLEP